MRIRYFFVLAIAVIVLSTARYDAKPHLAKPLKAPQRRAALIPGRPRKVIQPVQPHLVSGAAVHSQVSEDHGNVSVLHDDNTLVIPENNFDLAGKSLVFTPSGTGYSVQSVTPTFVNPGSAAQAVTLADDDSVSIKLPFAVKFFTGSYSTAYLNTDGNITFNGPDAVDLHDLRTQMAGLPRISPLFDDLYDYYGDSIGVELFSDHINFYWLGVYEYSTDQPVTFEVILQKSGVIQFNYDASTAATSAVVGLSPGNATSSQVVDLSQQTSPLSVPGVIGEVFSPFSDLDIPSISQVFYQTHPDNYDALMIYADFDIDLGGPVDYTEAVRNYTQGIGSGGYDYGVFFGSKGKLFITGNAGSVDQYPDDPTEVFLGPHSTLSLIGQMFGHAWMSYADTNPSSLLGFGGDNWSFAMNTLGSVMEGNEIQDLGGGQFQTINATYHYSPLDEYLMGLRAPSNVPDFFVVQSPVLVSAPPDFDCTPLQANCPAEIGVQFSGTRQNVSLATNIVPVIGARIPASTAAQHSFNVAFILITQNGQAVNPQNLAHLDNIRQQWEQWFPTATDSLGAMSTKLQAFAPTISSVTPAQALPIGGAQIAINGTNFQATSVVTIGGAVAPVVSATSTSLMVEAPRTSTAGVATLTVTNPDGQAATSSFTYSSPTVSQFQLTLPASGSTYTETSGTAATTQVGYAAINTGAAVAVIRSFAGSALISEASIPPTPAANQWTMYGEVVYSQKSGRATATGVAIANPGTAVANLTLSLSNGLKVPLQIPAGGQKAAFIDELFGGSVTSFLGTLTVTSDVPVSIVALRGTTNLEGQFIIATIPLSSGTPSTGAFQTFPTVTDGGGYNTELILVNSGTTPSTGTVGFSFSVATDLGTGTSFPFNIPAGGMWRVRTAGTHPGGVISGYATLNPDSTSPTPNATAMIRLSSPNGDLQSETAVPAQNQFSHALMFGSLETNRRTGIAILNPSGQPALVTLTPLNANGVPVVAPGILTVAPYNNSVKFLDEVISALPLGYEGAVLVQASTPVFAISLRGSTDSPNGFLMSTLPVIDLDKTYSGSFYFPQIVDGGGYSTQLLMLNPGSGSIQVRFFDTTGKPVTLTLK